MSETFTDKVKQKIAKIEYHRFYPSTLTVCVITTVSGFTITGESACVVAEHFDATMGQTLAHAEAFNKLVAFEAYVRSCENHSAIIDKFSNTSEYEAEPQPEESNFLTRLKTEHYELVKKFTKLIDFAKHQAANELLGKPTVDMSEKQFELLSKQMFIMKDYIKILDERIYDLTKE